MEDFNEGQQVAVQLSENHLLSGKKVEHKAKFLRYHIDRQWAHVELERVHAGGTKRLSVPVSVLKAVLVLFALLCVAFPTHAQFIGYTSPQTVQQTLATNAACTGAAQTFSVNNLGQIQHSAQVTAVGGGVVFLTVSISASSDGINFVTISDVGRGRGAPAVGAQGYYPVVQVTVVCGPVGGSSTFSLSYAGTAAPTQQSNGTFLFSQIAKQLFLGAAANTSTGSILAGTPFGTAGGVLSFTYSATGPSGSSLTVTCVGQVLGNPDWTTTFLPTTAATTQVFYVPSVPCPNYQVSYVSGGASAATYILEYLFSPPGAAPPAFQYTHVTTTTATAVKATSGFLHTLNINTAAAGTISVFDLATAACTGTPATNVVAVITALAATNDLPTLTYDINMLNGICVKASVAMDFTVSAD